MERFAASGWACKAFAISIKRCDPGSVVHRAVIDAVAVHGLADAEVIQMRGDHDVFVFQLRIVSRAQSDYIL